MVQEAWGAIAVLVFLGLAAGLSLLCLLRFWPHWSDADATGPAPAAAAG